MPQEVIDRVHALARNAPRDLAFVWRDGTAIADEDAADDDSDYDPDDGHSASDSHDADEAAIDMPIAGVDEDGKPQDDDEPINIDDKPTRHPEGRNSIPKAQPRPSWLMLTML
jgi:hypothetical protein